jgi:hypothetical protein
MFQQAGHEDKFQQVGTFRIHHTHIAADFANEKKGYDLQREAESSLQLALTQGEMAGTLHIRNP